MEKELREKIAAVIFFCWMLLSGMGMLIIISVDEGINSFIFFSVVAVGISIIVNRYLRKLIK